MWRKKRGEDDLFSRVICAGRRWRKRKGKGKVLGLKRPCSPVKKVGEGGGEKEVLGRG